MSNNYLWKISDASIANPESIYYSAEDNAIFVANVVGDELTKDGQGWIGKISAQGELIAAKWVEGLNAPHGMRAHRGKLWVADIDELVEIDIRSAEVVSRIPIPGSVFLNDVAISHDGKVFVSDTLNNQIYLVDQGKVTTFAEGPEMESPNGLFIKDNNLYVAGWGNITDDATFATDVPGNIFKLNLTSGEKQQITKAPLGNLDGIEQDSKGNLIVTDYTSGQLFVVNPTNGEQEQLISGLDGAADIGFIPDKNLVLIPSLSQSTITAYQYNPTLSQSEPNPELIKFWEDIEQAKLRFLEHLEQKLAKLRDFIGRQVQINPTIKSEAALEFNSGEAGYTQATLGNSQQSLITDGTLEQILESFDPSINNHLSSAYMEANWGGADYTKLSGAWGFEDLLYKGNWNFNDTAIHANPLYSSPTTNYRYDS